MSDVDKATAIKTPKGAPTAPERPKVKIVETYTHPETKRISLEPLQDEVIEQLLSEADQLFAQAKNKAVSK